MVLSRNFLWIEWKLNEPYASYIYIKKNVELKKSPLWSQEFDIQLWFYFFFVEIYIRLEYFNTRIIRNLWPWESKCFLFELVQMSPRNHAIFFNSALIFLLGMEKLQSWKNHRLRVKLFFWDMKKKWDQFIEKRYWHPKKQGVIQVFCDFQAFFHYFWCKDQKTPRSDQFYFNSHFIYMEIFTIWNCARTTRRSISWK